MSKVSSPLLYIAYRKWAAQRGHSRIWANVKVFKVRRRSSHASPVVWGVVTLAHIILSFPVTFRMWPLHRPLSNITSTDKIRTSPQWRGSGSGSKGSCKIAGLLPFISMVPMLLPSGTLAVIHFLCSSEHSSLWWTISWKESSRLHHHLQEWL